VVTQRRSHLFHVRQGWVPLIWARRLNPLNKQPLEEPFAIWHFHEARRSLSTLRLFEFELAVARDKLVFPMRELRGNIWLMEPQMPK
jgi:hypothetical protein